MSTVFVSSTFQDMQQERDILQNSVLPRIQEFAKQYGKSIDLCDLRWGVNSLGMDESESVTKVLQVCFDEIDNARPFFIALLGERYGWIPDEQVVERCLSGRDLNGQKLHGKSVTEMEILYAAAKNTDPEEIRFYFRDIVNPSSDLPDYYISKNPVDKRRMEELKSRIASDFRKQTRRYSAVWNETSSGLDGLNEFAEMVYQDLKEIIIHRWGPVPNLSSYDYQLNQFRYIIDSNAFVDHSSGELISSEIYPDRVILNKPAMSDQNYVLISEDERNLNILFASLCKNFEASGTIIPYDCGQSVLSSSPENLIQYFTYFLERTIRQISGSYPVQDEDENIKPAIRFRELLDQTDKILSEPMILAISNLHYLVKDQYFEWLPAKAYRNIHFLLTSCHQFPVPFAFRSLTREFFFPNRSIFSRRRLITSYMARFHKEIDQNVYYALDSKAGSQDDQYLELLMQRLLVLTQDDFEEIKESGDGIDNISRHLQKIISSAPAQTADFILDQLNILDQETEPGFGRALLAILSVLPYGITRRSLHELLKNSGLSFSTLDLSLFCRRMSSFVNQTLDGNLRMIRTPFSKILSELLINEIHEWTVTLEQYMSRSLKSQNDNLSSDDYEFYRSQYLDVALRANRDDCLEVYLDNTGHDKSYTALVMHRLASDDYTELLKKNFAHLSDRNIEWMAKDMYHYLSDQKMIQDEGFARIMAECWKTMINSWESCQEPSEHKNFIMFSLLYETGSMLHLNNLEDAQEYLMAAKTLSKENFRLYPGRLWKMVHGIELSEEEKYRGYESLGLNKDDTEQPIMFGFDGEIEDMEMEQSWRSEVRVINNYLAAIYRREGRTKEAEELENASGKITQMADPDPLNEGKTEITEGISVHWPEEFESGNNDNNTLKKRRYEPDKRRNSAIQISKDAQTLLLEHQYADALASYISSNEILKEIYADGETGEFYDLDDVAGDQDEIRVMIQKECARDIGLNYFKMIRCVNHEETNVQLFEYLDEMLSWAHIFDDYKGNQQSKADLESYYLLSASVYSRFNCPQKYYERIMRDIDRYYTYRNEACMKGEQTDETIVNDHKNADYIFFNTAINNPDRGTEFTDLLLKQSNASVTSNDFNSFLMLTGLAENLLKWMRDNGYEWKGAYCSLESIFFSDIHNQCMLWEKYNMSDRLKQDADRIIEILPYAKETESIMKCIESILRHALNVFRAGQYEDILPYADAVYRMILNREDLDNTSLLNQVFFALFAGFF